MTLFIFCHFSCSGFLTLPVTAQFFDKSGRFRPLNIFCVIWKPFEGHWPERLIPILPMIWHLPSRAQNSIGHLYPEIRIFEFLLLRRSQHLPKNFFKVFRYPKVFQTVFFIFIFLFLYRKTIRVTWMKNLTNQKMAQLT